MNEDEKAAFADPAILEFYKNVGEYKVYIGVEEPVLVTIRISETQTGDFTYETSHAIKTPQQAGPYYSSVRTYATPEQALQKAIRDFTSYYNSAVAEGLSPSSSWFVSLKSFGI